MCKRHQRAVPNEQKVLVFSTNNSSSNIYKISVFGKGKYCFHRPNNKIVKLNITTQIKKAVTVSTGSGKRISEGAKKSAIFLVHGVFTYEK